MFIRGGNLQTIRAQIQPSQRRKPDKSFCNRSLAAITLKILFGTVSLAYLVFSISNRGMLTVEYNLLSNPLDAITVG